MAASDSVVFIAEAPCKGLKRARTAVEWDGLTPSGNRPVSHHFESRAEAVRFKRRPPSRGTRRPVQRLELSNVRDRNPVPRGARHQTERRKHFRFAMKVPVIFTWKKPRGVPFRGEGVTRDVSLNGAYVSSSNCPPPNATVHIEIRLAQFSSAPGFMITARMRAQRVDRACLGERKGGFAVVGKGFVSHQFPQPHPTKVKLRNGRTGDKRGMAPYKIV
jgi:hypothetical protein